VAAVWLRIPLASPGLRGRPSRVKSLDDAATQGLPTKVDVLGHRRPGVPQLVRDEAARQASVIQDRRRRLAEVMAYVDLSSQYVEVQRPSRRARPEPWRSCLQRGHDLIAEPLKLLDVVGDRPHEHPLHAGIAERGELLQHGLRRPEG
jgi:hypothetical protein